MSLIFFIVGAMVVLNLGMVALTLGVKALRIVGGRRREKRARALEEVLEDSLFSGEVHPALREVRGRDLDLLAVLMVEYLTVLSGGERARLAALAEEAGLVNRYHRMLTARNRWRRARAAENLGYFGGPEAVTPLSGLLSHPDETLRAVAARALARVGTPEAAEKLAETLNDPSELTRLRMAENLERIGPLAVGPLVEALESGAPEARVLAARVLGNLRAAGARPALSRVARRGDSIDLRAQATLALGKAGDPEDLPVLLEACEDEEWPVRAQAANALEIVGDTSSIPALQKLTVDREWWVRLNASRALANMGPEGEKALARVLEGADRYARDRAVSTLEERGITRRAVDQLAEEGERGESSRALIQAMVKAGATRYLGGLRNRMPPGPGRDVLTAVLDGSAPEASSAPAGPPLPDAAPGEENVVEVRRDGGPGDIAESKGGQRHEL